MRRVFTAATVVLAASGCSSNLHNLGSFGAGSTPSIPKAPPADGGSYQTAQAVLDKLESAGVACTSPSPIANPTAPGALSMIDCIGVPGAADSDTVVMVFDSHSDALATATRIIGVQQSIGGDLYEAVGVNWVVNTVSTYGVKVLAALGGVHVQS